MDTCKIRMATHNDIFLLARLIRESFADVARRFQITPENCPKHPSNCVDEWIHNDFQTGRIYYILEKASHAVGCVALEQATPELFYLERLAVLPQTRGQGFGRILVAYVFAEVRKRQGKRISIGTIDEQEDLKSWYIKIGFHVTQIKHFPHLPFTVAFMEYKS